MGEREAAVELLDMYEARLRFIDVYDALLEKFTDAMIQAVAWERNECAVLADNLGTVDGWATSQMAANRIRERN